MKLVTVHLPEVYLAVLDNLVRQGQYSSRSEAIRTAIRDMIKDELSQFDAQQLKKKTPPLKELLKGFEVQEDPHPRP